MSFARPFSEARSILGAIQREKTDGADGEGSSPILHGSATSGVSVSVSTSNQNTQSKGSHTELTPLRTNVKVRTGTLTRKYASTGS
jgi:hypothetical protein